MRIGDIELTEPAEWNRETIADGNWLQTNTMKPLWDNEVALAEAIGRNKEVMNLYLLSPTSSDAPEVDPPNDGWWICDKDKNVVTKEALIEAHKSGYMLLLNETTDPDMNSRLYLPSETNIKTNYVHVMFESIYAMTNTYIEVIRLEVWADSDGRLRANNKVTRKVDGDRAKILKVSYETSPYAVDEEKQLAYLIDTKTNEYVKAEDCKKWINEEKRPMYIFGVANQDYVYHLSRFEDQGKSSGFQQYSMNFVCLATDYTYRRLVATFKSENINSDYATTKMRMYNLQDLAMQHQVVRVDEDQTLTDEQKTTARNNIAASDGKISWVKYNPGSPTPVEVKSSLSVVTSNQGTRIQNYDASEKFFVAPNFNTPADTGKVFTIDTDGAAKWKPIPKPEKDLSLQMYKDDLLNIGSNTSILKKIFIPEGTTMIEGSFNCYPHDDFDSLSVVLLKADGREYETSANLNFDQLLALDDVDSTARGQYNNTLNFKFKRNSSNDPFHSLAIKGKSGSNLSNYHVSNIQIMFYKERADGVSALSLQTASENESENG